MRRRPGRRGRGRLRPAAGSRPAPRAGERGGGSWQILGRGPGRRREGARGGRASERGGVGARREREGLAWEKPEKEPARLRLEAGPSLGVVGHAGLHDRAMSIPSIRRAKKNHGLSGPRMIYPDWPGCQSLFSWITPSLPPLAPRRQSGRSRARNPGRFRAGAPIPPAGARPSPWSDQQKSRPPWGRPALARLRENGGRGRRLGRGPDQSAGLLADLLPAVFDVGVAQGGVGVHGGVLEGLVFADAQGG